VVEQLGQRVVGQLEREQKQCLIVVGVVAGQQRARVQVGHVKEQLEPEQL